MTRIRKWLVLILSIPVVIAFLMFACIFVVIGFIALIVYPDQHEKGENENELWRKGELWQSNN